MIHFGKVPNEDTVKIEVSEIDLISLREVLSAMPLTERRGEWPKVKELIETDPDLNKWLKQKRGRSDDVVM